MLQVFMRVRPQTVAVLACLLVLGTCPAAGVGGRSHMEPAFTAAVTETYVGSSLDLSGEGCHPTGQLPLAEGDSPLSVYVINPGHSLLGASFDHLGNVIVWGLGVELQLEVPVSVTLEDDGTWSALVEVTEEWLALEEIWVTAICLTTLEADPENPEVIFNESLEAAIFGFGPVTVLAESPVEPPEPTLPPAPQVPAAPSFAG